MKGSLSTVRTVVSSGSQDVGVEACRYFVQCTEERNLLFVENSSAELEGAVPVAPGEELVQGQSF